MDLSPLIEFAKESTGVGWMIGISAMLWAFGHAMNGGADLVRAWKEKNRNR